MSWFFIVVLVILIAATVIGMKKGLIKMIFSLVSLVATIILVFIFAPKLSSAIKENTKIYDRVESTVSEKVIPEDIFKGLTEEQILEKINLPDVIKDALIKNNTADKYIEMGVNNFRDYLIKQVSNVFFTVGVFVVTFIIVFIALRILFGFVNALTKLPIIHTVNMWTGGAAGFVIALFGIWFFLAILTMFGGSGLSQDVFEQVNANAFLKFISDHNMIVKYVQAIIK